MRVLCLRALRWLRTKYRLKRGLCKFCGGRMKPATYLPQGWVHGKYGLGDDIVTYNYGGTTPLQGCMKCEDCGWSVK